MSKRKQGYYWIKRAGKKKWQIAFWDREYRAWYLPGSGIGFIDDEMFEIDERKIERP